MPPHKTNFKFLFYKLQTHSKSILSKLILIPRKIQFINPKKMYQSPSHIKFIILKSIPHNFHFIKINLYKIAFYQNNSHIKLI